MSNFHATTRKIGPFRPWSRTHRIFSIIFSVVVGIELLSLHINESARFLESSKHANRDIIGLPRNVGIAIVGDSISRYQYLSLVHYLHYGRWVGLEDSPSYVRSEDFDSWNDFYRETNIGLAPHELCDCVRDDILRDENMITQVVEHERVLLKDKLQSWKLKVLQSFGNRYYYDQELNNAVYYIQSFGHFPNRGHYNADEVSSLLLGEKKGTPFFDEWKPAKWEMGIVETIESHLAQLNPKPKYVVLNAGFWTHNFHDAEERFKVAYALRKMGMTGIYRTTSKRINETDSTIPLYEKYFCRILQNCLDFSWTGPEVKSDMYLDKMHFAAPVYQRLNEQLFDLIDGID